MRKKRIIVLSEHFFPSTGATAQLAYDLACQLQAKGHKIIILTATPQVRQKSEKHIFDVITFNKSQKKKANLFLNSFKGIYFLICSLGWCLFSANNKDKLVIFSNPPYAGALGLIVKLIRRIDYIFVFQDVFPRSAVLSGILPASGPITGAWQLLMSIICLQAKCTVTLSQAMEQRLKKDLYFKTNLQVIHNWAVERASAGEWRRNAFAQANNLGTKFTVQYSGNFGRLHDLMTLLEAARILKNQAIDFCFIGDGHKKNQISSYKLAFGLNNVMLLPYQPRSSLHLSLASCDLSAIGLMPGAEDTVSPCKFYGILASGKAVILIAQKGCDLAKFVEENKIGIVVEPGESDLLAETLLMLKEDPGKVLEMQLNAENSYKKSFGLAKSADLYHQLLVPKCQELS